ncbi:hypothetical protein LWI28_025022 [Acer negundo]|uniref:Uncharacterized protein n=1 Tax=Acer negundo TaxID=4023 RepID=A0AAD5IN03_ACENE|nr:hypothetical protein LWI28_025022 [Acer negundo]
MDSLFLELIPGVLGGRRKSKEEEMSYQCTEGKGVIVSASRFCCCYRGFLKAVGSSGSKENFPQAGFRYFKSLLSFLGIDAPFTPSGDSILSHRSLKGMRNLFPGRKGYDSKPLPGRRASRTRGRRSTIHSRDSY